MAKNFAESDRVIAEIRTSYDSIMEYLPKAAYLKRAFEDRYLDALKNKIDLSFFLKGEQNFLERFLVEAQAVKDRKEAYQDRNEGGFAENVLKQIQSSIANYPTLDALEPKCIKEVSRLYGAINQFLGYYWDGIAYYMRGINTDLGVEIDRLERSLSDIYNTSESRPPKAVEFYNDMVRNHTGTSSERIRAAQDAIQFAGIWLNNLRRILNLSIEQSSEEPSQDIDVAAVKLGTIISDFRLQAFAKREL